MGRASEAVARVGEEPDVVTGESAPAARAPAGQASAGWKVLPIVEGLVLLIALVLPWVLQDYLTVFATRVVILALFALSFDLVWGYAGIMSFGQALFFGAAGYGVALMARDLNVTSILLILPAGALIGLTASLLLGGFLLLGRYPSSVIFVSLGTLTGSYAADRLARGWYYLGGQNGIPSIPPLTLGSYEFEEGPVYYYMVLGILVVVYLLCRFLVRSQFGLALAGLRENEQRIAFFGYKAQHLKAIIFAVGGTIAGLAGSLYAFHEASSGPTCWASCSRPGRALRVVRRLRHLDRRRDRHRDHRGRQLLAVGQLPRHLADHPRRAAAARHHVPPARADLVRAWRARAGGQFRQGAKGDRQCRSLRRKGSARCSASSLRLTARR